MLNVQQYTLFENSADFDRLIKKSQQDIETMNEANYIDFLKNILPDIKHKRKAFILYENNNAIGYEIFSIKNKCVNFSFSYIVPEKRGKGYSYFLREKTIEFFWNETFIFQNFNNSSFSPSPFYKRLYIIVCHSIRCIVYRYKEIIENETHNIGFF